MAFCQPIIRHSDQAVMCKVSDTPGATRPANKPNNSISTAWISKASAYSWRTRRRAHCTHSAQQALPSTKQAIEISVEEARLNWPSASASARLDTMPVMWEVY
jgi:hypothetical protein